MATVTFLVHPDRPDALALANDTAAWLKGRGDRRASCASAARTGSTTTGSSATSVWSTWPARRWR